MATQTLMCAYDPDVGPSWSPSLTACQPTNCTNLYPATPLNSTMLATKVPNRFNLKQYLTSILYTCPSNTSLPLLLSSNFSFDYPKSAGIVNNVTASCDLDRYFCHRIVSRFLFQCFFKISSSTWIMYNSPLKGSCPSNTDTYEHCAQPVIPKCVDRNVYCALPPAVPAWAQVVDIQRPLTLWNNVPDTK